MFVTTIRIEPASDNPSFAQAWINGITAVPNLMGSLWLLSAETVFRSACDAHRACFRAWTKG